MTAGLSSAGFVAASLDAVLAEVNASLLASVSPNLNLTETSVLGIIAGIVAEREAVVWQEAQNVWSAGDPAAAEDGPLDILCALTGTRRYDPRKSLCRAVQLSLDASTTVPQGAVVRVQGNPTARFVSKSAVTSASAGTYTVDFEGESTGPTIANAGTLTDIATAIAGWHAATNPTDAVPGDAGETDYALRIRRRSELTSTGSGLVDSIRSRMLRYVASDGSRPIQQCGVFENDTGATDGAGRPAHSVEVLIYDANVLSDDAVAQVLWDNGACAGITTYGNAGGTATDSEGITHAVSFSRSELIEVLWEVTVSANVDFTITTGVAAIKAAVEAYPFAQGESVFRSLIYPAVLAVPGVRYIARVRACRVGGSLAEADIALSARQLAYTQAADITVIVA